MAYYNDATCEEMERVMKEVGEICENLELRRELQKAMEIAEIDGNTEAVKYYREQIARLEAEGRELATRDDESVLHLERRARLAEADGKHEQAARFREMANHVKRQNAEKARKKK